MQQPQKQALSILSPVATARPIENTKTLELIHSLGLFDVAIYEPHHFSEVDRARIKAANMALPRVREKGGLVLWLDSDMVLPSAQMFVDHVAAVIDTNHPISGRYVLRRGTNELAASPDHFARRDEKRVAGWRLEPVLSGMGCLLMRAHHFVSQMESSPSGVHADGTREYFCCTSQIIEHPRFEKVLMSEDFVYCRSLEMGVWFASKDDAYINYGHLTTRPLLPDDGQHGHGEGVRL